MAISKSLGNQLGRLTLAITGAKAHSGELPKEAGSAAATLEARHKTIMELNEQQEKAKQELARITKQIVSEIKAAQKERSKIVRYAEATYGPRDPRLKEFRPASEGRSKKGDGEE